MGASVSVKQRTKFAGLFAVIADVTLDDEYPTNGEALTPNQFGLNTFSFVLPAPAAGYHFEFDHANRKLKAYVPVSAVAGEGVAGADNTLIKSSTGTVEVAGNGTAFQVPAAEVANKTDMEDIVVRVLAIGL
jgi:hypothetical protein